ncbi:MAG: hypothetical protein HY594_02710, partial [Candidatus Omnitrophica bacterium]|nr:hypothetical protein [Candidatus Omnitrophota bacterium]
MKIKKLRDLIQESETKNSFWQMTPHHELEYVGRGREQRMKFKGALIAAEPDALVISVSEKQSDHETVSRLVKLAGTWKANSKNQLVFEVEREGGRK